MTAFDSNVLIRFLVADDPDQSARAAAAVSRTLEAGDSIFVSDVVLAETVWVLNRSYRFTRMEIAEVLHRLLAARDLEFESSDRIARTLRAYRTGGGGFADYLILQSARDHGAAAVYTFDKKLLGQEGFLEP